MGNKLVKFDDALFYKILTLYTICCQAHNIVPAHCNYFILNMFSATTCSFFANRSILSRLKKLCLLKSENDHKMSQSQTVDQTKLP